VPNQTASAIDETNRLKAPWPEIPRPSNWFGSIRDRIALRAADSKAGFVASVEAGSRIN